MPSYFMRLGPTPQALTMPRRPRTLATVLGVCLSVRVGATSPFSSPFAFQISSSTASVTPRESSRHQPRDRHAHSHRASAFVVLTGRGEQSRWTSTRGERRQWSTCSMAANGGPTGGIFDPLGFGQEDYFSRQAVNLRFNTPGDRGINDQCTGPRQPLSSQLGSRGRVSRRSVLQAFSVNVDDAGAISKGKAVSAPAAVRGEAAARANEIPETSTEGERVSKPAGDNEKGWEYWGYRGLLLVVAAIWGTNFPVVKFVEGHAAVSDATAAFVRFAIAAGAMLPFADWSLKEELFAGMEVGAWVAFGYFTQAIGLQTSDASVCAFLCSLTVVFVPLLDALAGKGIKLVTVAASLLALTGTGFLELGDASASWSDVWCVAQAVGFGMAFTRIEHYMKKFPGKSLQLSIGQLISVAGLTGVWCLWSSGGHLPDISFLKDPEIAAALGYTGLITTSLAIWLETIALERVPASEMSVIFSTEPLWATLVSRIFLKETMGPNAAVGAACILLACLTAQSEQIMELLGKGTKGTTDVVGAADTVDIINGAALDADVTAMDACGVGDGQNGSNRVASFKSSEIGLQLETVVMAEVDEQGIEPSASIETNGSSKKLDGDSDLLERLPLLDQYMVPMELSIGDGLAFEEEEPTQGTNGLQGSEMEVGGWECFQPLVK